jgi:hypothetical protein
LRWPKAGFTRTLHRLPCAAGFLCKLRMQHLARHDTRPPIFCSSVKASPPDLSSPGNVRPRRPRLVAGQTV